MEMISFDEMDEESTKPSVRLSSFPSKILFKILSYVNESDLCRVIRVNKEMRLFMHTEEWEILWKSLCASRFNLNTENFTLSPDSSWKDEFQRLHSVKLKEDSGLKRCEPISQEELKLYKENIYELLQDLDVMEAAFSYQITDLMSRRGIPMKYLGLLRTLVTPPRLKTLIFVEMTAIAFHEDLCSKVVTANDPKQLVIDRLNLVLGRNPKCDEYYENDLKRALLYYFPSALTPAEENQPLEKHFNSAVSFQLIRSITRVTGLELKFEAHTKLLQTYKDRTRPRNRTYHTSCSSTLSSSMIYSRRSTTGTSVRSSMIVTPDSSLTGSTLEYQPTTSSSLEGSSANTPTPTDNVELTVDDLVEASFTKFIQKIKSLHEEEEMLKEQQRQDNSSCKKELSDAELDDEWIIINKKATETPIPNNTTYKFKWMKKRIQLGAVKLKSQIFD